MNGKALLSRLNKRLYESSTSAFMDDFTSYQFFYEAATELAKRTKVFQKTQTITTVAGTAGYDLEPDFVELWIRKSDEVPVIRINDGTNNTFIPEAARGYDDIVMGDLSSTSAAIADRFAIIPNVSLESQITGSATSTAAVSLGIATLTDTAADLTTVKPGDYISNTTDGSDGIVTAITSTTEVDTALFGGTNNDWTSGDSYVVQPQSRWQIVLDPPPSTAGYTVTVWYIARPDPVFHDMGIYPFPSEYHASLVEYAAWKYKEQDSEYNFGEAHYAAWEDGVKKAVGAINRGLRRNHTMRVSWKGRK
jgi:hypothetical protein